MVPSPCSTLTSTDGTTNFSSAIRRLPFLVRTFFSFSTKQGGRSVVIPGYNDICSNRLYLQTETISPKLPFPHYTPVLADFHTTGFPGSCKMEKRNKQKGACEEGLQERDAVGSMLPMKQQTTRSRKYTPFSTRLNYCLVLISVEKLRGYKNCFSVVMNYGLRQRLRAHCRCNHRRRLSGLPVSVSTLSVLKRYTLENK